VSKEIREMVVFATQDVIMDPPFTKVDLVSCRNLLIYLAPEMQKKVIPVFHYSLNQGGALFLGPAETIGGLDELFSVINDRWKIFKRKKTPTSGARIVELPSSLVARSVGREYARGKEKEAALPEIIERILLDEYAPSAALINSKGEIIYIHGRTGKYLEPSPGKANLNMIMMAREGLKRELSSALHKAVSQKTDVTLKGLRVKTNGSEQGLDVVIRRFEKPESMRELLLILFQEVETPKKPGTRAGRREISPDERMTADELEKELDETRERLRITVEEMETTEEESKVATEELQSTNEELQSTNEELTTAKEELQSENEELMTVNSEMRLKNDQLEAANNDMRNLLNSISIATIFMDNELKIKRFTPQVTGIINLIPTDVGRPITDIASNLNYHDLAADSRNVLDTLAFKERQVQSTDGRWYLMRITPYRTAENYIDGIVVTFNDIDSVKRYEAERDARAYSESIVATVREPLVVLDSDLKVVSASRSFYKTFHVTSDQTVGRPIYDLGNRQWDIPELREFLENVLPKHTEFHDFRVEHDFEKVGHRVMLLNARQIQGESTRPQMILLAIEDIT